jgi:hypothetical protein
LFTTGYKGLNEGGCEAFCFCFLAFDFLDVRGFWKEGLLEGGLLKVKELLKQNCYKRTWDSANPGAKTLREIMLKNTLRENMGQSESKESGFKE